MPERLILTTFMAALLLSAGLLFNIQPMVGKMLLPLVGGTPAVWNVAMAFFQLSLLLGYLIAHLLSRLPATLHALAYVGALSLATLFLPIALPADWRPDPDSYVPFQVLGLLATTVAVPFITLSLSAPTLQRLFAATRHEQAADPYFLYVASNLGSFTGLLIYPLVLEPRFGVGTQTVLWQQIFAGLIALGLLCLLMQRSHPAPADTVTTTSPQPDGRQCTRWVLLAAIPSSLTLGVTTYITTDVSPTPLFWVITLGLYLLTYIIAFARRGEALRQLNLRTYHWAGCLAIGFFLVPVNAPWAMVALNLTAFFAVALACHTRLAQSRPPADRLTGFYFWMSLGGALGGAFNAFLAPLIFSQLFEYPVLLILGMLAFIPGDDQNSGRRGNLAVATLVIAVLTVTSAIALKMLEAAHLLSIFLALFVSVALILLRVHRLTFLLAGIALVIGITLMNLHENTVFTGRDFFGVLSVNEVTDPDTQVTYRILNHGNTSHGMQIVRPNLQTVPTTYYSPLSPVGNLFSLLHPQTVALIGLGTGAINCYARPGQQFHFFEIDPLVVRIATDYFSFITDCPPPRITIGDGRLELARDPDRYNLIVVDAFSSDSIPVHLITQEAVALYAGKLTPGGVIAIHVSNRFFNLVPMIAAIAANLDLTVLRGYSLTNAVLPDVIHSPSEWLMLAPQAATLQPLLRPPAADHAIWQPARPRPDIRAWTDEYSNLLSVLKWQPVLMPGAGAAP